MLLPWCARFPSLSASTKSSTVVMKHIYRYVNTHMYKSVSINQSIFYFMSVHIEVILDQKQQQQQKQLFILIFPQDYEQSI